jgi:hypothetical protein
MLRYAASGAEGDAQAISAATGIPMGESSGKVPAILDYCLGMRLIYLAGAPRSAVKKPVLTDFGRSVLLEDPYLKTGISQWIAHFNLCCPISGADVWYHVFFESSQSLGMSFTRTELERYLNLIYGAGAQIGPIIGMYEDEAAFGLCRAIEESKSLIKRKPAPLNDEYGYAYGAWLIQLLEDHFPKQGQVSITELNTVGGWRTIPAWDVSTLQRALALIERKGFIEVDRHMEPWLIRPNIIAESAWKQIFDDLI